MRLSRQKMTAQSPPAGGGRAALIAGGWLRRVNAAFTIIELLAVVVIISLVATISVPAIRGLSHSNVMTAATRQLMDDLALARQTAINSRATVYVVFLSPNIELFRSSRPGDYIPTTNLYAKVYTSYALYSDRSLGAQPGQANPRYLTEWKTLPTGALVSPAKFNLGLAGVYPQFRLKAGLPLPLADSPPAPLNLPCVAFNYTGGLVDPFTLQPTAVDELIPLSQGSVFYNSAGGNVVPDVVETPPQTATSLTYHRIRINWLTGRCRLEVPTFK